MARWLPAAPSIAGSALHRVVLRDAMSIETRLDSRINSRRWQHHTFWRNLMDDISGRSLATAQQELKRWAELGNERSA